MHYGTCFLCGKEGLLEEHHVFNGPFRKKSDQYGMVVGLCGESCHRNGRKSVHRCGETAFAVKRYFQIKYMQEHQCSVRDFIREWGRNYLDEESCIDEGSYEMNHLALSGRLTADPVLRYTKNNKAVCTFKIAAYRPKSKNTTDFIRCVAWDREAEHLCKYFKKGKWIEIEGRITSRDVTDQQGNKRSEMEVIVDDIFFGGSRKDEEAPPPVTQAAPPQQQDYQSTPESGGFHEIHEDDDGEGELPF